MVEKEKHKTYDTIPVYAPALGLAGHVPPTMLKKQYAADCLNVRFKNGEVIKRTGYVDYGTGAITGYPLGFYRYQNWAGTEYAMLVTTTNVYYLNVAAWTSIAATLGGSVDTRFSMCTIQNTLIFANSAIVAKKSDGTSWADVANATSYKPQIVLPYGERLVMFNVTEFDALDWIPVPIRIRWSAAGTFETWTGTGSSFFDVTDGMGAKIVGAELMGNYVGVYKDYSISLMDYIAGASIFAIDVHINNMGLAARSAIVNLHTHHVFLGWDNVYAWDGGWKLQEIGNPIKDELFDEINDSKIGRSFMLHCPREHEIHLFVPLGTDDYPTRFWTFRYEITSEGVKGVWSKGLLASISGAGSVTSGGVERPLLGLSAGGIEHYDYSVVNDNGVKIDGLFETPDFSVNEEEYLLEREMFNGFSAEAYGDTITLSYSIDGGNSYTDIAAKTLQSTSLYKLEDWYFKKHGQQIRFKLRNNVISETFRFRFYGIKVIPREAHK